MSYSLIWGPVQRWPHGPHILAAIVVWLRDRSLVATIENNRVTLDVPMPEVRSKLIGYPNEPIESLIPVELRGTFVAQLAEAAGHQYQAAYPVIQQLTDNRLTPRLIARYNAVFQRHEREVKAAANPVNPTLQLRVARSFGFEDGILPVPALLNFVEKPNVREVPNH